MKKIILSFLVMLTLSAFALAQSSITPAPAGFDMARSGIALGKIDTIVYKSKTVGVTRKSLIYTPPGYSSQKNIRFFICCMELVATKKNGFLRANLR